MLEGRWEKRGLQMPNADLSGHAGRRLAAIVCADVEGYARLMKADETGTMRLLTAHRDISDLGGMLIFENVGADFVDTVRGARLFVRAAD